MSFRIYRCQYSFCKQAFPAARTAAMAAVLPLGAARELTYEEALDAHMPTWGVIRGAAIPAVEGSNIAGLSQIAVLRNFQPDFDAAGIVHR
jgi:hypothetical protein